jgi:hypothetical protein
MPELPTGNPPTQKQRELLAFFGRSASSAAEAHRIIGECLSDPIEGRRWLVERARRCVADMKPAIQGQKGHSALFAVCCTIAHGFALNEDECWTVLRDYNQRCQPPFCDRDLDYKLRSAASVAHKEPRGHLVGDQFAQRSTAQIVKPKPALAPATPKIGYDPEKLATLARQWRDVVNLPWLANRSAHDPALVTSADFLRILYPAGEKILTFDVFKSQGQALWPSEQPPAAGPDGVWFLPQPVDGETYPNPRTGKPSRRSEESVREFRYLVLESDQADARDWLGFIVRLPLRIEAIYTSAGRSIHALVRVNCRTKGEFDAYKAKLLPTLNLLRLGGVDDAVFSSVRLTRLPGAYRDGKLQKLLYLRPGAPARPICELPAVRDVVADWRALAALGIADSDENGTAAKRVLAALHYYAPASRPVRETLCQYQQTLREAGFDCD